jgi:hypothetical protein
MITAFLSYNAFYTKYFALSASYYAIYFSSIALVNSTPNARSVIDTSSIMIIKSAALSSSVFLIRKLICSLYVNNYDALYCATTDLSTSLTIEGKTLAS